MAARTNDAPLGPVKRQTMADSAAKHGVDINDVNKDRKQFQYKHEDLRCRWFLGFVGCCGAYQYYLDKPCMAAVCCLTFGGLGIGWLCDGLQLHELLDERNSDITF